MPAYDKHSDLKGAFFTLKAGISKFVSQFKLSR